MARTAVAKAKPKTCLAFLACHRQEALHGPLPGHPEQAARVTACSERLANNKLWPLLKKLAPRKATDVELQAVHEKSHIEGLSKLATLAAQTGKPQFVPSHGPMGISGPSSEVRADETGDTYVTAESLEAARFAAGGLLQGIDETLSSEGLRTGLVLCRPPGHHASSARSSGFCLVNNVATAAAYALQFETVKRVLIFDWDVHHGQGTQQIFENSESVLFVSIHRHDGHSFYPATGSPFEAGSGRGKGLTVNVALPESFGDLAIWTACAQVLLPAARSFRPDLILVSAGFDAAAGDPIGRCDVTPRCFGLLTLELRRLAAEVSDSRIIFALEGGYNVDVLADCVEEVAMALVEVNYEAPFAVAPDWLQGKSCQGPIRKTCEVHKGPPLRLPMPPSKKERRRSEAAHADQREESRPEDAPASIQVVDGILKVKISIAKPMDVLVAPQEIHVWSSNKEKPYKWRISGTSVEDSTREAQFIASRQELCLHLRMGQVKGPIALTPMER